MNNHYNVERKKEEYYLKAKKQDYRSRASFKLLQLNRKFKLIRKGDSVVDLGAAPGGWSQVALEIVGEDGLVVAVDLNRIKPFPEENFHRIKGDFVAPETVKEIKHVLKGRSDIVLSDASPKLSGIKDLDQVISIELARSVIKICEDVLKNKGNLIMKVFQGEGFPELLQDLKKKFRTVKTTKPPSSKKKSVEMYIVARGFKKRY